MGDTKLKKGLTITGVGAKRGDRKRPPPWCSMAHQSTSGEGRCGGEWMTTCRRKNWGGKGAGCFPKVQERARENHKVRE